MIPLHHISRRAALRGMLAGSAVSVGLPFLDCFLNENGTALAATGQPLPVRFGTWFWGCGLNPGRWEPKKIGADWDVQPETEFLRPHKAKVNIYSGMRAFLDGKPNGVHFSGAQACLTGTVPRGLGGGSAPSIDTLVSDVIGARSRFRSLEVACTGNPSHSQSRRSGAIQNPAEVSPLALYTRVFGPEFKDPNASDFTPDAGVMVRRSALSAVTEERQALMRDLGAADKARLEEYFTSLRELEKQLDIELQRPAPLEACTVPKGPQETATATEIETVKTNHKLFAGLLAHALACGQTRVANIAFADATSSLRKAGGTQTHHECTHEEPIDVTLGYQKELGWFYQQIMESFAYWIATLDGVREGDGTLLDHMVVMGSTDHGYAKLHGLENMPLFTAGAAGGRMKTGVHVQALGDSVSRLGLTLQQVMGLPVGSWGTESNQTAKPFTEVVAA